MRTPAVISIICTAALFLSACSREDYRSSLVGTWEWTGDSCDTGGNCKKEIITDDGNRETFTAGGLYLSRHARIGYVVAGSEIRLATDTDKFNTVYGEILSIKNGIMVLKKDSGTRRYSRVGGTK